MLLSVPERSFYDVLRFYKKYFFLVIGFFFSSDRIFEKSENFGFSKNLIFENLKSGFFENLRFSDFSKIRSAGKKKSRSSIFFI